MPSLWKSYVSADAFSRTNSSFVRLSLLPRLFFQWMWVCKWRKSAINAIVSTHWVAVDPKFYSFPWNLTFSTWYIRLDMLVEFKSILCSNFKSISNINGRAISIKELSPSEIPNVKDTQSFLEDRAYANEINLVIVCGSAQLKTMRKRLSWAWLAAKDINFTLESSGLLKVLSSSLALDYFGQ